MNAVTDTLPHNANRHMWAKIPSAICKICTGKQTLVHVLNCSLTALKNRRYNLDILRALSAFTSNHLPDRYQMTSDLPEEQYSFPQQEATSEERPDIVLWSSIAIHLIELTVSFETGFEEAVDRKRRQYSTLATQCTERGYKTAIHTIEVGSRGFTNIPSLENFYCLLKTPRKKEAELEQEIVRKCIAYTHMIYGVQETGRNSQFIATHLSLIIPPCPCMISIVFILVETSGAFGPSALAFLHEIGRRIKTQTGDPSSTYYLLQHISIAIQRGNTESVLGTMSHATDLPLFF